MLYVDVFKFDNSKGLTRPKEVFYTIKNLPPNVEPSHAARIDHTSDRPPSTSQGEEVDESSEEVNPLEEKIQSWLDQGETLIKRRKYSVSDKIQPSPTFVIILHGYLSCD